MARDTNVRLRAVHRIEARGGKKGDEVEKIILPGEIFFGGDAKEVKRLLDLGAAVVVEDPQAPVNAAELAE